MFSLVIPAGRSKGRAAPKKTSTLRMLTADCCSRNNFSIAAKYLNATTSTPLKSGTYYLY